MHHHARHDASGAYIHPSEQQSHNESVEPLQHVSVYQTEQCSRCNDGNPSLLMASKVEQTAQYGSTEHHFFGYRHQHANCYESHIVVHHALEHLLVYVGHLQSGGIECCRKRNGGSNGEAYHPEQCEPWARVEVD